MQTYFASNGEIINIKVEMGFSPHGLSELQAVNSKMFIKLMTLFLVILLGLI